MSTPTKFLDLTYNATGAELAIIPDAIAQKENSIAALTQIKAISNAQELEAGFNLVAIAAGLEKRMEATRTEVKAPVLALGKLIDETAKNYVAGITTEKARVLAIVNEYNRKEKERIDKIRADAEKAERDRLAAIEAKRLEEERAVAIAEQKRQAEAKELERLAEVEREKVRQAALEVEPDEDPAMVELRNAASKAEYDRIEEERIAAAQALQDAQQAQRDNEETLRLQRESERTAVAAPLVIAVAKKPTGMSVKRVPKYEVTDIMEVLKVHPGLVTVEISPAETIKAIRGGMETCPGLRIWWENETNVRSV